MASSTNKAIGWELKGFSTDKDATAEKFYVSKTSPIDEMISLGEFDEMAVLEIKDDIVLILGFPKDRTDLPLKMDCNQCRFLAFKIHSKEFKFYKDIVSPNKGELALHAYFKPLAGNFYAGGKIHYATLLGMWQSLEEPWGVVLGSKVEESTLGEDFRAIVSEIKSKTGASQGGGNNKFTPQKTYKEKYLEKLAVVAPLLWKLNNPGTAMPEGLDLESVAIQEFRDLRPEGLDLVNLLLP